jgi:hypothetical protein
MMRSIPATLVLSVLLLVIPPQSRASSETILTPDNAYNPIPSPDGKYIAYVRTGWGRHVGISGFSRSNLVSEVVVVDTSGNLIEKNPVADAFLSGWTPDSTSLACYRDGEYSLVSMNGKRRSKARLPGATNVIGTERVSYLPRSGLMVWSRQYGFHTVLETPHGVLAQHDLGKRVR